MISYLMHQCWPLATEQSGDECKKTKYLIYTKYIILCANTTKVCRHLARPGPPACTGYASPARWDVSQAVVLPHTVLADDSFFYQAVAFWLWHTEASCSLRFHDYQLRGQVCDSKNIPAPFSWDQATNLDQRENGHPSAKMAAEDSDITFCSFKYTIRQLWSALQRHMSFLAAKSLIKSSYNSFCASSPLMLMTARPLNLSCHSLKHRYVLINLSLEKLHSAEATVTGRVNAI